MNTKQEFPSCLQAFEKRPLLFICAPMRSDIVLLGEHLTSESFKIRHIHESAEAIHETVDHMPEFVLLDANIPEAGGYKVCDAIRPFYYGHIFMLGHTLDEASQLLAFERGVDDYVILPASPALLTARIKARLKRNRNVARQSEENKIRSGDLVLNVARREAFLAGNTVTFTAIQFEILWYLAKHSGRVISRKEIFEMLYHEKYNGFDRSVDVHISRIRQQLGEDVDNPVYLKTVRGVGYLFMDGEPHW